MTLSIRESLQQATKQLLAQGVDSASLDARILLEFVTGFSTEKLLINSALPLTVQQAKHYQELLDQRLQFKPIAYILGQKEFYGLNFNVTENVLIPRPDSECLVEAAIKYAHQSDIKNILELGVGSGCLLLSILTNLSATIEATAVDLSPAAIEVTKQNYQKLGLKNPIEFLVQNWGEKLIKKYDCVISNPPYISPKDIATLQPDVQNFEPRLALDGGEDGLECYRIIAQQLPNLLTPHGVALFEIGIKQAEPISKIFNDQGFKVIEQIPDLAGIIRCLAIKFAN